MAGTNDQQQTCAVWDQTCNACGRQNPFAKVCLLKLENKQGTICCIKDEVAMDDLIANVTLDPETNTDTR